MYDFLCFYVVFLYFVLPNCFYKTLIFQFCFIETLESQINNNQIGLRLF